MNCIYFENLYHLQFCITSTDANPIHWLTSTRTTFLQLSSARLAIFAFCCFLLFALSCTHTTPPPMNLLFSSDSWWKPSLHIILVFRVFLILTPSSLLSVFFPAPSLEPPRARAVSPPTVLACNCQPWENEWKAGVSSNDLQSPIQLAQSIFVSTTLKLIPQCTECLR